MLVLKMEDNWSSVYGYKINTTTTTTTTTSTTINITISNHY